MANLSNLSAGTLDMLMGGCLKANVTTAPQPLLHREFNLQLSAL